jgi:hypothetical protein
VAQVAFQAVWAAGLDLQPHFKAFDVEDVVALARETLDALMSFEVLKTNIAAAEAHVSVALQENDCLYLTEVLIMILPNLFEGLWHLSVLSNNVLLVLNVVYDTPLHQEDAIFV